MHDEGLAESLRLQVSISHDGRLLETTLDPEGEGGKSVWKRGRRLGDHPSNVFLYESFQQGFRAVKSVGRQDKKVDYRLELNMMERVLREVKVRPYHRELFVHLIGWFPSEDFIHFVLEYCPYGDISGKEYTPMSEMEAWSVCNQLMQGLSVLHGLGIIHRDIKPQNVLVADISPIRIKIADFGISKLAHRDDAQSAAKDTTNAGTPQYKAPEILGLIERSGSRPAVDMWSLGCLMHYVLTGEVPFREQDSNKSSSNLPKYCEGLNEFPEEPMARHRVSLSGRHFVRRLLARFPEDRPLALGETMKDWEFPSNPASEVSMTTEPDTESQILDDNAFRNESINIHDFLIPDVRQSVAPGLDMNLLSSELWHLMKSERGGKLDRYRLGLLLQSGASPNAYYKGYTAFHIAAEQGTTESLEALLLYGANCAAHTESNQETAIHLATVLGNSTLFIEKVGLLLKSRMVIDVLNKDGNPALHLAILRIGTVDAIEVLLKNGASTELKGRYGRTPLQYAIFLEREEAAQTLLDYKASSDCEDDEGLTPLHLAARSKKLSISLMERLIGNGARINPEDKNRHTPLFEAATHGRENFIRLLINHGAECRPYSKELEARLAQPQSRPRSKLRIPWLS